MRANDLDTLLGMSVGTSENKKTVHNESRARPRPGPSFSAHNDAPYDILELFVLLLGILAHRALAALCGARRLSGQSEHAQIDGGGDEIHQ